MTATDFGGLVSEDMQDFDPETEGTEPQESSHEEEKQEERPVIPERLLMSPFLKEMSKHHFWKLSDDHVGWQQKIWCVDRLSAIHSRAPSPR